MNDVKILITGKNPDLYIKRYILNKIEYKSYKQLDRYNVSIIINYKDYIKLLNIKTLYKISIVKYNGFIKYKHMIKNNLSFFICFILSIISILFLSNVCFDIEIIHNNKNIRNIVKKQLQNNKIKKYHVIPSFDKRKIIVDNIINNNKNDIEWLEIEKKGSKLIVKITERKINKNKNELKIRNIVASKEGIIKKITASQGQIMKKENDYVSKGDIIVSGNIIKDDTIKMQVPATGSVFAEVWYKVQVKQPLFKEELKYKDGYKKSLEIKLFNKTIFGSKIDNRYKLKSKNSIFKNRIFPFNVVLKKYQKANIIKKRVSNNNAKSQAIKLATLEIEKLLDNEEYIINKKILSFNTNDSKIIIDVFISVYENITEYQDINN